MAAQVVRCAGCGCTCAADPAWTIRGLGECCRGTWRAGGPVPERQRDERMAGQLAAEARIRRARGERA
jgi:hypothetical protein